MVAPSLMWFSVQQSTREQYQIAYGHWVYVTNELGTNPLLTVIPPSFTTTSHLGQNLTFCESALVAFWIYLRAHRGNVPKTINSYTSGVSFFLKNSGMDVSWMTSSPQLNMIKSGLNTLYRMEPGSAEADSVTLAFPANMVQRTIAEKLANSNKDFAIATAMQTALTALLRISEYVQTSAEHHLLARSVIFTLRKINGSTIRIPSDEAHRYELSCLLEVTLIVRDAKNDAEGAGHSFAYPVQESVNPDISFDIAVQLFRCAQRLRPSANGPFFTCPHENWSLKESDINSTIKMGAVLFGFNPSRFSTHSLRIAGASALAAAGYPSWFIQLAGRWKSIQFLTYIRLASAQFSQMITATASLSQFSHSDLFRWQAASAVIPSST